jgi:hypothetical protein
VTDKQSGQIYWWNEDSGETTALGEPRPGPEGRVAALTPPRLGSATAGLLGLVGVGAGMGLVFGVLRHLF